jgi:hypothetical protein
MVETKITILDGKAYLEVKTVGSNNGLGPIFYLKEPLEVGEHPEIVKHNKKMEKARAKQLKLAEEQKAKTEEINRQMKAEFEKLEQEKHSRLQQLRSEIEKKILGGK